MMGLSLGIGAAVALVVIIVVSILTGGHVTDGNSTNALVGKKVATFQLGGLERGTVTAPWQSHHAAVLIFFASFGEPCKSEMPRSRSTCAITTKARFGSSVSTRWTRGVRRRPSSRT